MNDLTTTQPATAGNPFARNLPGHVNAGTVAIEAERAIAEAQGKLVIAKRFPRDPALAYQRVMEACSRPGLADEAMYAYKRGGATVTGPSIRLAEELARCWGNIDYGIRELSRKAGESEMEAYAWDLETNTVTSQKFTVRHVRDTQQGRKDLTDERDIYEIGANMGARRLRARLLAILPPDLVEGAVARCRATLAGNVEVPLADRVRGVVDAFAGLGISAQLVERFLGKPLTEVLPEELGDLRAIYRAIKDGTAKASEFFSAPADDSQPAPEQPNGARRPRALAAVAAAANTEVKPANAPAEDDPSPAPAGDPSGDGDF
jgi:hypothetical protein